MKFTVNEVVLSLKEDDDSYLKTYPAEKYNIVVILFRKGFKVIHLVRKEYQGDILPIECYYGVLDQYDEINRDDYSDIDGSFFEYFKVIEAEPVQGKVRIVSKEDK